MVQASSGLGTKDPKAPSSWSGFAAWEDSWKYLLTGGISRTSIDLFQRLHLRSSETGIRIGAFAKQDSWVEMTFPRIIDHAVLHTIECIAFIEHGSCDGWDFAGRQVAILARADCLLIPYLRGGEMGRVPSWVTGDDARIVGRVALGLHECLPATVRATAEIRRWLLAVKGGDDVLRVHRSGMNCAVAVIYDLLLGPDSPVCIGDGGLVSGVGGRSSISGGERLRHTRRIPGRRKVIDRTGEAAIADAKISSVPT